MTFTVNANDDLTSVAQRLEAQGIIVERRPSRCYVERQDEALVARAGQLPARPATRWATLPIAYGPRRS